jgi:putative phosphoribosyl transferase
MKPLFRDRRDAGRALAAALRPKVAGAEPVILAVPRGGVPVAFEVATSLRAPLDVCIVRSIEVPKNDGVRMGAVASGRVLILEQKIVDAFSVSEKDLLRSIRKQALQISRCEKAYRGEDPALSVTGRSVILIDDGIAGTNSLVTTVAAVRARMPARIVVATPVASEPSYGQLSRMVEDVVCLDIPMPFHGVGACYADFSEVSDLDVRRLHTMAQRLLREATALN